METSAIQKQTADIVEATAWVKAIKTPEHCSQIGAYTQTIKALQGEIKATFDPIIAKTHAAHKEACDQRRKFLMPLEREEARLKNIIAAFLRHQKQVEAQREAKLRVQQTAAIEKAAVKVEKAGDAEGAEMLRNAPIPSPQVEHYRLEGTSTRENWKAEITDVSKVPRKYMVPDQGQLNAVMKATQGKAEIPGVKAIRLDIVSVLK